MRTMCELSRTSYLYLETSRIFLNYLDSKIITINFFGKFKFPYESNRDSIRILCGDVDHQTINDNHRKAT